MRVEGGGAVGADHPQVLEPVVVRDAVDVIEHQGHAATLPMFVLTAQLAPRFQQATID